MARHDRARVGANDVGIEIEAGLAFGTGHHGTTRGCLLHFDRLLKRRRPAAVLDVGCGAGVLAIAAAKVLQRKVWLGDIDPVAVEVANANARLNGVGALCRAVVSRGVESARLARGRALRPRVRQHPGEALAAARAVARRGHRRADGEAIVSGLLLADVAGVLAVLAGAGVQSGRADRPRRLGEPQTAAVKSSAPPFVTPCRASVA